MTTRGKTFILLLAAVLVFSSVAWAPVQSADAADLAAQPTFKVRVVGRDLVITGKGFPARRAYAVFVRTNTENGWWFLGGLHSRGRGKIRAGLRLPPDYVNAEVLRVCLIDQVNGGQHCQLLIRRRW